MKGDYVPLAGDEKGAVHSGGPINWFLGLFGSKKQGGQIVNAPAAAPAVVVSPVTFTKCAARIISIADSFTLHGDEKTSFGSLQAELASYIELKHSKSYDEAVHLKVIASLDHAITMMGNSALKNKVEQIRAQMSDDPVPFLASALRK